MVTSESDASEMSSFNSQDLSGFLSADEIEEMELQSLVNSLVCPG